MSTPTREELLTLALGVLPPLPGPVIDVLSEDGGSFSVTLSTHEGGLLHGFAPRTSVRNDLHLLARIFDQVRGRYEVELQVVEAFYHTGEEALVHLAVNAVRHRKARRAAPRAAAAEPGTARVKYCRSMPRDAELEVRLADLSATGLAFLSQHELAAGDLFQLEFRLQGKPISLETRIVRCDPAPYGRYRCGCEITAISDHDRQVISSLAAARREDGSADQRNPETVELRARVRAESSGLSSRLRDNA